MKFDDILTIFRESLTEKDKGTRFERLMRSWLLTDPRYNQIETVWMWEDFPAKKEFSSTGHDLGIDLVARTQLGDYWAIQCKCYAETTTIEKKHVDSFLSTSSRTFTCPKTNQKVAFSNRLWISTTNHWGPNAEDTLENQNPPISRVNLFDLQTSPVDWERLFAGQEGAAAIDQTKAKRPCGHQLDAISAAKVHYLDKGNDRGKLIMACGTGKTYTSLRMMEDLLDQKGLILFLVPSISLLGQTLNEWSADARKQIKAICICSDATASRNRNAKDNDNDDIQHTVVDLALPASTNPNSISKQLRAYRKHDGLVVVFSTYQSIEAVKQAQDQVLKDTNREYGIFDFIVCDEAHRTTGGHVKDADESDFSKIHDAEYILGKRRLYMTATPRIFSDTIKAKAVENDCVLYSMDNEAWYGKEFFHVGFGYAVEHGLLTDYKVFVLTVSEDDIPKDLAEKIQDGFNQELTYNDTAKLVGVVSGLSKIIRGDEGETWKIDPRLMHRALAFCSQIGNTQKPGTSKNIASILPQVSDIVLKNAKPEEREHIVRIDARHVDGSMTSARRAEDLQWLASEPETPNECKVITNVRCLSEGVDVPALDSVIFLSARNSQVDVVQSVGRVMRNFAKGTADEKKYGYIIIPVVVPTDADPGKILEANDFKTVWSILNALRSHDDRFNAHVNKIQLNKKRNDKVVVGRQGVSNTFSIGQGENDYDVPEDFERQLALQFDEVEDRIYAKLVEKVGDRMYWETWAKQMGEIARQFIARINRLIESGEYAKDIDLFVKSLQRDINPSITQDQAIEMLAQHMITKPVFDALFAEYQFVKNNSVSRSMEAMLVKLHGDAFEKDTDVLQKFYESVKINVSGIDNLAGKQTIIKNLYEKFFAGAFKTTVEQLGIVYTPIECVDFIIHSVDAILRKEFNSSLSDEGVHVLDPFTGTGTFITRLLQSGLIRKEDFVRKYCEEIHCNEIVLLAYYIADVNIEAVFHDLTKRTDYLPYNNICLTDTFQLAEPVRNEMFTPFFQQNNENVLKLRKQPIRVIIGNPPYSVGQKSANDNAQNLTYPVVDGRIERTYATHSTATMKGALYDSYIKAFRWSSDRIPKDDGGIVAFISNGAWLDGNACDGFRRCIEQEFSSIYVLNLRGNQRTSGELSRKEGGKIFGSGSRTPISITFLIKNPSSTAQKATIYYHDIGDYLTREQKLAMVKDFHSIEGVEWQTITPNEKGDWINQRDGVFDGLIPISSDKKIDTSSQSFFALNSCGLKTSRDAWCYNSNKENLVANLKTSINYYNTEVERIKKIVVGWSKKEKEKAFDLVNVDSTKFTWDRAQRESDLPNGVTYVFDESSVIDAIYRPFFRQRVYANRKMNNCVYKMPSLFPQRDSENIIICVPGAGNTKPFDCLIADSVVDLGIMSAAQCLPMYFYEENSKKEMSLFDDPSQDKYIRHDGVTDWILKEVRNRYSGTKVISKEHIFYYVYGILHSPEYRKRFADDLKKSLPRIPIVERVEDFMAIAKIGRELADLHLNYETVAPCQRVKIKGDKYFTFPDGLRLPRLGNYRPEDENVYRLYDVEKMRFGKTTDEAGKKVDDKTVIVYNNSIVLENIPLAAYDYIVNGKSAIEWIMERYAITTDKASGIVNNPNDWAREHSKPRYILDLLLSIINLSLKTNDLVAQLPKLDLYITEEDFSPQEKEEPKTKTIVTKSGNQTNIYNITGDLKIETYIETK